MYLYRLADLFIHVSFFIYHLAYTYICTYTHTYTHACTYTHTHTHTYTYAHTYTYIYMYIVHINEHIMKNKHVHIHIHIHVGFWLQRVRGGKAAGCSPCRRLARGLREACAKLARGLREGLLARGPPIKLHETVFIFICIIL